MSVLRNGSSPLPGRGAREMYAVLLSGRRTVEVGKVPRPQLDEPGQVLLRMAYAGICGSDLHYYRDGRIGDQKVRFPMIVGHEGTAQVVEVSEGVTKLRSGQDVVLDPALVCGACDQCRTGRANTCRALRFLGSPGGPAGCMAEYLVMPESCCHPLPPQVSRRQGVLAEPLSIALHTLRLLGPHLPQTMAILGAGPIGLCLLAAASANGVRGIYVTDPLDWRCEAALRLGAEWAASPNTTDMLREILGAMPGGVEVVVECCGEQAALDQALQLLAPGGKLAIVGIPRTNKVRLDINLLRRKELTILNVRRQNACLAEALTLLAGQLHDLALVTHEYPLCDAPRAFAAAAAYEHGIIKAVVRLQ
ncbi:MAG: alcohol dehydrogenase catalytic domain-containing protein [Calditrichaeota bacterium]|nr:alcohol dehydrogenase catalytic domain-containing protein [Calditrichota bacterium]